MILKNERISSMKLPQELFADELWGEWFYNYGVIQKAKIPEMLKNII